MAHSAHGPRWERYGGDPEAESKGQRPKRAARYGDRGASRIHIPNR
jgi:hypothetical protein